MLIFFSIFSQFVAAMLAVCRGHLQRLVQVHHTVLARLLHQLAHHPRCLIAHRERRLRLYHRHPLLQFHLVLLIRKHLHRAGLGM